MINNLLEKNVTVIYVRIRIFALEIFDPLDSVQNSIALKQAPIQCH